MGNLLLAGANQEVLQLECGTAQTVVLLPQDVRLVGYTARHLRKVRVDELARLEYVRMPRRNFPADLPGLARRMPHLRPPSGFSGMSSVAWTFVNVGCREHLPGRARCCNGNLASVADTPRWQERPCRSGQAWRSAYYWVDDCSIFAWLCHLRPLSLVALTDVATCNPCEHSALWYMSERRYAVVGLSFSQQENP